MSRTSLFPLLIVAVVTAGALAWAPPPPSEGLATDACRDSWEASGGPQQTCETTRVLTWGAGDACHEVSEATDDDAEDACVALTGQARGEAELAAYEDSWVHRAHADQRRLQAEVPFARATFLATHNSYNSYAYLPTLSHEDANQWYSIRDQLRMDIRRIELDVHWWVDRETGQRAPILCHATGPHVGCTWEDTLTAGLTEIRSWLDQHPDEVVMIRLETHLDGQEGHEAAAATLDQVLGDRLFKREADAGTCPDMPLDLTVAEVRAAGRQVVVVSDCGEGAAFPALVYRYDSNEHSVGPGDAEAYAGEECGGRWTRAEIDAQWVRVFEDGTWLSDMAATPGRGPQGLTPSVAADLIRCGINQPSVDHLTPADGRLGAFVWSWAAGENDAPDGRDCAAHGADGRFHAGSCQQALPVTCSADGGFTLTEARVAFVDAADACVAEFGPDAEFTVPASARENQVLRDAKDTFGVDWCWIAFARQDGIWRVP